jgi:hypothetical protein
MSNLQNGNPGYLSVSSTVFYSWPPLVALPPARLPTTQFLLCTVSNHKSITYASSRNPLQITLPWNWEHN